LFSPTTADKLWNSASTALGCFVHHDVDAEAPGDRIQNKISGYRPHIPGLGPAATII